MEHNTKPENLKTYWWDTMSLAETRKNFSIALKDGKLSPDELAWKWVQYFGVANLNGVTVTAARCFPKLMKLPRNGGAPLIENLTEAKLRGLLLMAFRALMALAESALVSIETISEAAADVLRLARRLGVTHHQIAFQRLALAVRLGSIQDYEGDYLKARESWRESDGTVLPFALAGCEAGRASILVEWLLAMNHEDEAMKLAEEASLSSPCVTPCGIAPQTTLAFSLAPLVRGQCHEKFRSAIRSLSAAAPPTCRAWLMPTGCRMAAMAQLGECMAALELYEEASRFAMDAEIPCWRRLHFHLGAAALFQKTSCGADSRFAFHRAEADRLAAGLDARNGNNHGTLWLARHYSL
jgi:hypothetical protein